MFKYVIILISYINGCWLTLNISFSTGGYTTTNLVNSITNATTCGYSIDSDTTSGYPRIQNQTGSVLSGTINNFSFMFNEMYMRLYPVIRDKNTLVLTDGSNTSTLTSTAIIATALKSATTAIVVSNATAPSSGQVLTATNSTTAT